MKKNRFGRFFGEKLGLLSLATFVAFAFTVMSCGEDPVPVIGAPPTVTASPTSAAGVIGAAVSTQVTISAPEGATTLTILKNGAPDAAYPPVSLSGTTATYAFTYTIESTLSAGNTVNFTFVAQDTRDRSSAPTTFAVTVSANPPKARVQVGGVSLLPGYDEHIVGVAVAGLEGTYIQNRNVTLTADKDYFLIGFVRVGPIPTAGQTPQNDDGRTEGVLTIQPGTTVFGDLATKGTLVIQRGGKLIAEGEVNKPIVFTSIRRPGERTPGDWGGVVLCGRARNNEGPNVQLEGGYGAWHGGTNDADDSGVMKYVRIEWAGIPINPNEEVNTLTMGSVGRTTEIEYVQASFGLDDQFEWFGGTVDGRHLIAYRGLDDDFDVDLGHSGNIQFAIGIRDAKDADQSGSNGFEVDNNGSGELREPFTSSVFSNVTIIGPKKLRETSISSEFQHGAQLRRSSKLRIYNSIITGYPMGIFIDGNGSTSFAQNDELQLRNVILAGVKGWGGNGFGKAFNENRAWDNQSAINSASFPDLPAAGLPFLDANGNARPNHPGSEPRGHSIRWTVQAFDARAWFNTPAYGNKFFGAWDEIGISPSVFDLGTPTFTVVAASAAATGGKWDNVPFVQSSTKSQWFGAFEQVPFAGAFGTSEDWTQGWANFSRNTVYRD
ncbi:Ig-like domain repeat protein [Aquiflexum sp. LQ15W]|uniref:Ig-like domain repeat protein n=1 Tax=Cognataquiflexum nitidum TaxID=2922272 RepID=UPI001F1437E7|nr:Ig-like domain repeat protein [Cognataquiflexum nitidum]MCH6199757.1 Ig-like domain repeat protein [Cognataquiflexum nitidum]